MRFIVAMVDNVVMGRVIIDSVVIDSTMIVDCYGGGLSR